VVVKDVADGDLLEIALTENVQREDLNPIEEAQAYQKLIERVGLTQRRWRRFGRDRSYITNYLRLLRLPEDVQHLVEEDDYRPVTRELFWDYPNTISNAERLDM
jgi:ParB family chromosome partitioning protein